EHDFGDRDRDSAFDFMQLRFAEQGHKLPILFKQYAACYEAGGFQTIVFSVDPDFGDCLDGLCMGDISKLKQGKRRRYFTDPASQQA
ncbi:MAG: GNAT family N-acetyltransferase, partial [Cellvibrionaceae bacterium]|nr:GNAT family N-acetyltransferase [Cellvibrionaceae bacterium]